jgi:hypothetical protein
MFIYLGACMIKPASAIAAIVVVSIVLTPVFSRYSGFLSAKLKAFGMSAELVVDGRSLQDDDHDNIGQKTSDQ